MYTTMGRENPEKERVRPDYSDNIQEKPNFFSHGFYIIQNFNYLCNPLKEHSSTWQRKAKQIESR